MWRCGDHLPTSVLSNTIYLYNCLNFFVTIKHFMLINKYIYTISIFLLLSMVLTYYYRF